MIMFQTKYTQNCITFQYQKKDLRATHCQKIILVDSTILKTLSKNNLIYYHNMITI